jgi:hypothetical protein
MKNDISCQYYEDEDLVWFIRVSPTFLDISNNTESVHVSLDVSTDNQKIQYNKSDMCNKNAYIEQGTFQTKDCTIGVGTVIYKSEDDVPPNGSLEEGTVILKYNVVKMEFPIPFEVARIVLGIADGLSVDQLEEFGATDIEKM